MKTGSGSFVNEQKTSPGGCQRDGLPSLIDDDCEEYSSFIKTLSHPDSLHSKGMINTSHTDTSHMQTDAGAMRSNTTTFCNIDTNITNSTNIPNYMGILGPIHTNSITTEGNSSNLNTIGHSNNIHNIDNNHNVNDLQSIGSSGLANMDCPTNSNSTTNNSSKYMPTINQGQSQGQNSNTNSQNVTSNRYKNTTRSHQSKEVSNDNDSHQQTNTSSHRYNYLYKHHIWESDEDDKLREGIKKFGLDWSAVSKFVGNKRSRSQCEQRWNRVLDPSISRKPWTEDEEALLLQLVQIHGDRSWKTLAEQMPNRNDSQCRFHYIHMQKINQSIQKSFHVSSFVENNTKYNFNNSSSDHEEKSVKNLPSPETTEEDVSPNIQNNSNKVLPNINNIPSFSQNIDNVSHLNPMNVNMNMNINPIPNIATINGINTMNPIVNGMNPVVNGMNPLVNGMNPMNINPMNSMNQMNLSLNTIRPNMPSNIPSNMPSNILSNIPSNLPSNIPTNIPTIITDISQQYIDPQSNPNAYNINSMNNFGSQQMIPSTIAGYPGGMLHLPNDPQMNIFPTWGKSPGTL